MAIFSSGLFIIAVGNSLLWLRNTRGGETTMQTITATVISVILMLYFGVTLVIN